MAVTTCPPCVMAGLGPATHDLRDISSLKTWVAGPSPAMTQGGYSARLEKDARLAPNETSELGAAPGPEICPSPAAGS